nr:unnamed protein product [Callosobruchus analis]CAI5835147.1 unnamed protein product [Callosobruchus analis]
MSDAIPLILRLTASSPKIICVAFRTHGFINSSPIVCGFLLLCYQKRYFKFLVGILLPSHVGM